MSRPVEDILNDAMKMPPADRALLAERLIRSLDEQVDPDADAAWQDEVARRWEEIQADQAALVPWEAVRERIQGRLRGPR